MGHNRNFLTGLLLHVSTMEYYATITNKETDVWTDMEKCLRMAKGGKASFRTECTLFYLYKENEYTFVNVRKYLGKKMCQTFKVANSGEWDSGEEIGIFIFWFFACMCVHICLIKKNNEFSKFSLKKKEMAEHSKGSSL